MDTQYEKSIVRNFKAGISVCLTGQDYCRWRGWQWESWNGWALR